jgi:hypothetical protein
MKVLALLLLLSISASAESRWRRAYKWSTAALIASSTADVASSWNKPERNALLRSGPQGSFGPHGVGIKVGVLAGALIGQHFLVKAHPATSRPLSLANFGIAGFTAGVATMNWTKQ